MEQVIKIFSITERTHDVRSYRCEKPQDYDFVPGQATEVSINKEGWRDEKRPFTFTSLPGDEYLEFTIKSYFDHPGVTSQLHQLNPGDELIVRDVWGAIEYKGPGYFIAGGAGITPFISIFRQLSKEGTIDGNALFFSNKTGRDIILEEELNAMLGKNVVHVLTQESHAKYLNDYIDEEFLKQNVEDFNKNFYVCGPPSMVETMQAILTSVGVSADAVVFEK